MIKTPSCYPRWQQYNTCLAAPAVTVKGHHKSEPKAKHFSHCKKDQSSRPNQTDNSKRLAKITNLIINPQFIGLNKHAAKEDYIE